LIGAWAKSEIELKIARSFSEKRIGSYKNADMKVLVRLIGQWWLLSGVNNEANAKELIVIANYIHDNYQNLTYTDIELSMSMTINGSLIMEYEPFIRLSASYISKCINAYMKYKSMVVNEALQKTEAYHQRKEVEKKHQEITPEQRMQIFSEILETSYKMAKEKGEILDFESRMYSWLRATKQIRMSQPDVDEAINFGRTKYKKLYGDQPVNKPKEDIIKKFGREHVVVRYFLETPLTKILEYLTPEYFNK
jgi:hypothetical protein